ncbi:hypothetical protein K435DRAFT_775475 [Dendrothele bispora CBS 962.96]|uniref:ZW10 C-terminal helical domain-containing protein n=1 Tax=Dendrothele bispora (strain CBS 962.96) TaxID=1314807 RepID=A0A4S8MIC2_DENBC|nr:hypothetical protein K435DRAFT_775475 [Dendrothele bispora CBS 962.96]
MAFPVPSHLPRKALSQDVTAGILTKIDEATTKSLTASLAKEWLDELNATIRSTKQRINDRIRNDLPQFEQQLQSSISVQARLEALTSNVDSLSNSLSDPKTGLVPSLLRSLNAHSTLAQESTKARIIHEALSHLSKVNAEYQSLSALVQAGQLPEAFEACRHLEQQLAETPTALNESAIMVDLKRRFNATRTRAEDQLNDAYSRSVVILPHELVIHPSTEVRQSETTITLDSILSSLSPDSLSNILVTLRRDISSHYVDTLLSQPMSVSTVFERAHKLTCTPSPPNDEVLSTRLDNLSQTLEFLNTHLFTHLPAPQSSAFPTSLCKPISASMLNKLITPSLPKSFNQLQRYLSLVADAVTFENKYLVGTLGNDSRDRPIKAWADEVGGHYERRRRELILDNTRTLILTPDDLARTFEVQVDLPTTESEVIIVQTNEDVNGANETSNDAWGFDDDAEPEPEPGPEETADDDAWGFDDGDTPGIPDEEPAPETNGHEGADDDAWGWNDSEDVAEVEDDPWGDAESTSNSRPPPAPSIKSPKVATKLEKLANKGKKTMNGASPMSPAVKAPPSPIAPTALHSASATSAPEKRLPQLDVSSPKETFKVSERMNDILGIVRDVLREAQELIDSRLVSPGQVYSNPGSTLFQTAPAVLDLYRALYPVVFSAQMESIEGPMRFSNNSLYLSQEVAKIADTNAGTAKERLVESSRILKVLGDSWYEDTTEKYRQVVDDIIDEGAAGFQYTGEQDRYDECESAMNRVLQEIRRLASKWKGILTKSKYYTAIGMVTDAALSRVLQDIIALPDIPEVESRQLSELCKILHALEGLFVEEHDPEQRSFVVAYVPSWLKYSYLSELLEASLADITYLFEEGALVDFEVQELATLVRALFADTVLRTNTINKIMNGHPASSS